MQESIRGRLTHLVEHLLPEVVDAGLPAVHIPREFLSQCFVQLHGCDAAEKIQNGMNCQDSMVSAVRHHERHEAHQQLE